MTPAAAPGRPARRAGARAWTATLVTIGVLVTTVGLSNVPGTEADGELTDLGVLLWLASVGAWCTVAVRRTRPWVTAGAGLALALLGSEYLLLLVGVFHLMLTLRGRQRVTVAAGTAAVVALWWIRDVITPWEADVFGLDDGSGVSPAAASAAVAVMSLAATAGAVALALSRRDASAAHSRAAAATAHATSLGDELARRAEREEIAREIHDGLTNRLALLAMMGGNVERAVGRADPSAAELARMLQAQSREALGDLRGLVDDLRSGPSSSLIARGTMRDVPALVAAARDAGTTVNATVILEDASHVAPALDAAAHRMVQEALTNAVKHAPGAAVSVYVAAAPDTGVRLRVSNALTASAHPVAAAGGGSGLLGIAERARALRGTAWTGAHEGEFIVDVTLPWSGGIPVSDRASSLTA